MNYHYEVGDSAFDWPYIASLELRTISLPNIELSFEWTDLS